MLDPRSRVEMSRLLAELNQSRGLTIVHATHALEEVVMAGRVLVLERGRIAWESTPAALFADLRRLRSLRLVVPALAELGERLRALGVALPLDPITPEAGVPALAGHTGA